MRGRRADVVRDYAPASLQSLDRWYKKHGAETPPRTLCSAVRWRIYLAAKRNPKRYRATRDADALA